MRWVTKYLLVIMAASLLIAYMNPACAMSEDISYLKKLVSSNEDARINSQDLAFFLATHNYGAFPRDGYVEVELDGRICKLVPNGTKPGLCDIAF